MTELYLLLLLPAFYWLMVETNWLRARIIVDHFTLLQMVTGLLGVVLYVSMFSEILDALDEDLNKEAKQ